MFKINLEQLKLQRISHRNVVMYTVQDVSYASKYKFMKYLSNQSESTVDGRVTY